MLNAECRMLNAKALQPRLALVNLLTDQLVNFPQNPLP